MRHVQREGSVAVTGAVVALVMLAGAHGHAFDPACPPDVTPLAVVHQRLFRHDGLLVADVVVANVERTVIEHVHVGVELYDFFGALLRAERTVVMPSVLHPDYRASFRVATPFTQDGRTVAYRFTGLRNAHGFQSLVVCRAGL